MMQANTSREVRSRRRTTTRLISSAVPLAALVVGLLACSDPPPSNYPSQEVYVEDTTLGPGDLFEVRVYRQEELSREYSVSSEGTIAFPLIGEVVIAGRTPAAIENELRQRLSDGFLKSPQVSVLVKEYKSKKISIFGQVRKPGTISFADGMTIVEAIARAGGFTDLARKNAVTVTRKTTEQGKYTVPVESIGKGKAANFFVRPGDVVFVPRRLW